MLRIAAFCVLVLAISQVAGDDYVPVDFVENLNNPDAGQSRIVSGWEAVPGQHPHQAALRMVNLLGSVSSCGGSVVAREWVITSAHCVATRITVLVRAGLVWLSQAEAVAESSVYYIYPTFDASRPGVVQPDDIALVKLPVRLTYSSNLRPIRIQPRADAHRNYDNEVVYASGFGRTWTNGPTTEVLRWTYLRAVSNPTCERVFGARIITPNTLCARYYNVTSQSVCQGDSGGPLVHADARGAPTLVGVSSFVAGEPFGCHSGMPSGFARPGPFHSWYNIVTGLDFENLNEEDDTTTTTTTTTTTALPPNTTTTTMTTPTLTTPNITMTTPTITTPNITMTTPNITMTTPTITTPNITITTPNITITTPTITTPNITMTTPNITMTTPNITMTTPNITMTTPNITMTTPTITTPNITMTTPNITMTTPNITMTTPNITMTTPNITMTTPNITMTTPNITMTTPNITMTTPNITITTPTITTSNITYPTLTTPIIPSTTTPDSTTLTTPNMTISTTTPTPPTPTPAPEDDSDEEDDPELSELLKRLEVKVGVVVRLTKRGRNNKEVLVE